jgi:hydrogenase maturation protease
MPPPKTLVIGLGNPILGDDGVGWRVAEALRNADFGFRAETDSAIRNPQSEIEIDCFALGGLSLMERMVGYDRAIVIDAVTTGQPPGAVSCVRLADLGDFSTVHTSAAHDTSLQNALKVGRKMGAHLPETVMVVGVEADRLYDFSEDLTPAVAAAVPRAVQAVLDLLKQFSPEEQVP